MTEPAAFQWEGLSLGPGVSAEIWCAAEPPRISSREAVRPARGSAPQYDRTLPYCHAQSSQGAFVVCFDVLAEDSGDDILVR